MAVIRVAGKCQGSHKPTTSTGCGNADLAAEFIPFMRLALADTSYVRFMNTVHLVFVVSLLGKDTSAHGKQGVQGFIGCSTVSLNITDYPAKIGSQFTGTAPCSFHLAGVGVPTLLADKFSG